MTLELVFPALGKALPTDHAYALYAALSGVVSQFHDETSPLRFAPITGRATPDGLLRLTEHSCLRVRLPADMVQVALPLAGKRLTIGDAFVRLGVPSVRSLVGAPSVIARLVTFKNADTPEQFLTTARAKLADLGVAGETQLPLHVDGDRAGTPQRRVVRVKGVTIPGYSLIVAELSAADSLILQESGLGGRTRLGCGFFTSIKSAS
ncbi:MAG: type I-MYXAN CRISPR-associated protein Cas6/Cmx6 [Vicinamibacterales bacterium]